MDLQFYANLIVAGLAVGAVYAVFGLGITMVYKATRVPNFAHAAVGAIGAYVFYKTWDQSTSLQNTKLRFQIPFTGLQWTPDPPALPMVVSLLLALLVVAALGVFIERFVMRRVAGAPTLNLIVVTVALFVVLTGLAGDIFGQEQEAIRSVFPVDINDPSNFNYDVAGVRFSANDLGVFIVTIGLAAGLAAFFRFTTLGVAIRATADSREVSRLLGIDANRVAQFSWAVGSMLACIAGILITPSTSLSSFGLASLIVFGFGAALFGGFTSLVGTLGGGLLLGVLGNLAKSAPWPDSFPTEFYSLQSILAGNGAAAFVTLLVVIVILLFRPKFIFKGVRLDEDTGVRFTRSGSGLNPEDVLRRKFDRGGSLGLLLADWKLGRYVLGGGLLAFILVIPLFTVSYWSTVLAFGVTGSMIALSVIVITGWTGQISLAPLTFLGVGAYATAIFTEELHWYFWLAVPLAGLATVPFAVLIGLPALRLRGFYFALVTLAFAVAGENWLFTLPQLSAASDVNAGPLTEFDQPKFYVGLLAAAGLYAAVRNIQKTRVARTFYAMRDSELTAQILGINPVKYKLLAFALAGFIGGVAGSIQGFLNPTLQAGTFGLTFSLTWVLNTVVSGVGVLFGGVLAGFLFSVLPQLVAAPTTGVNQAPIIIGGLLAISTITDYPNGLASFLLRLVRPFDRSERIAWASAESDRPAPAAGEDDEERIFDLAASERTSMPVAVGVGR